MSQDEKPGFVSKDENYGHFPEGGSGSGAIEQSEAFGVR